MPRLLPVPLLAAIALAAAGCAGDGTASDGETPAPVESDAAGLPGALTFEGSDAIAWTNPEQTAAAGTVDITLVCGDNVNHRLAIEGVQDGADLAQCDPGGVDTTTVDLEAGTTTFYCTVPGHREAGMEGTLTVT